MMNLESFSCDSQIFPAVLFVCMYLWPYNGIYMCWEAATINLDYSELSLLMLRGKDL